MIIIYGRLLGEDFFRVAEEITAISASEDIFFVMECQTVGEARELREKGIDVPGTELDDEDVPDDESYHWAWTAEAQSGEWPPGSSDGSDLPDSLLQELAAGAGGHWTGGEEQSLFVVPLGREEDLVRVLRSAGCGVRRDDLQIACTTAGPI